MRSLAALLLAGIASADPAHTEADLAAELRPLAWLLGNWKAEGEFSGMKCQEDIRYWPDLDGQVLIERAIVIDENGTVLRENRIVFWAEKSEIHACMIERPPVHSNNLAWKKTDAGFELAPGKAGGPSLAYTKKGDDAYDCVYEAKDEKGTAVRATWSAKRTKDDFPDSGYELALSLADVEQALGRFSGSGGDDKNPIRDSQQGRAILGGEVLQIRISQKHKEGQLKLRVFVWPTGDGQFWSGWLFSNAEMNGVELEGRSGQGFLKLQVPARKPSAGATFRWEWTSDSYEWSIGSIVDPTMARTFKGKRAR